MRTAGDIYININLGYQYMSGEVVELRPHGLYLINGATNRALLHWNEQGMMLTGEDHMRVTECEERVRGMNGWLWEIGHHGEREHGIKVRTLMMTSYAAGQRLVAESIGHQGFVHGSSSGVDQVLKMMKRLLACDEAALWSSSVRTHTSS